MSEQRHMPNMFQHMFSFSVLLFFVLLMAFGGTAVHAERNTPNETQLPEAVDLFVPCRTIVETQGQNQTRDSFAFPSLTSAGGVLVALAEGSTDSMCPDRKYALAHYNDIVAGYIDSVESWSPFVAKFSANESKAHSTFSTTIQEEHETRVRYALRP
ncbi:trans-sialidase, partial [Trypanosoma rangeli SC58]